jgi:uncharacterized protein YciI
MKKLTGLCVCLSVILAPAFAGATGGAMNSEERAYLIERLEQSKKDVLASISDLTDAQWRFKPAPNVWSARECAEHIILAEGFLFGMAQQALSTPAVERPASAVLQRDKLVFAAVLDRSKKATAPEPITPTGSKFATPGEAAREFTQARERSIQYVRSTPDELRTHIAKSPAGDMDAYQLLVVMAAHSARHTLQIREVEANAGYPATTSKLHFLVTYTLAHGDLDQVTKEQIAIVVQHAAYVKTQLDQGHITWGGRTMDPKHPRGLAIFEVSSEEEVRDYVKHDPAVVSGFFQWTIEGFTELNRDGPAGGR